MKLHRNAIALLRSNRGSSVTIVSLLIMTVLLVVVGVTLFRGDEPATVVPQGADAVDDQALYIAQTALDRSIKTLLSNPGWRDGFDKVPFAEGTYSVQVRDADGDRRGVPPNYVSILASSEVSGVRKEVEAVWVNALAAFQHTYSAGNNVSIGHDDGSRVTFLGRIHNNAWKRGDVTIAGGVTFYGDITSVGDIVVGDGEGETVIYGSVRGARIDLEGSGEIRLFENMSEWVEGIDLNRDGDATDIGLTRTPFELVASEAFVSAKRALANGDTDRHVANGNVAVTVGADGVGPIVDPRPDFITFYELASGLSEYPPIRDHVSSPIPGDGDGHYFASAKAFTDWIRFNTPTQAKCWRCAGDGRIDPGNTTQCPTCDGTGSERAVEVTGVFYVDDAELDLSQLQVNLIVHGTIVIAEGDPYDWPKRDVRVPGGQATIAHYPEQGSFVIGGESRASLSITYRSDERGGRYRWRKAALFSGEDAQTVSIPAPSDERAMRDYPAIVAADRVQVEPRHAGFAYHPGDIGDESLTILQGVVFAENEIAMHGRGGWSGETLVFDENTKRAQDEALDEPVLNVDLNGDGDTFDRVGLAAISTVPLVPAGTGRYCVDINSDGVLTEIKIGVDYREFFAERGHRYPTLIYHEGILIAQDIHTCDQVLVLHDAAILESGIPFGFEVNFGATTYQGLVSWHERDGGR